MKPIFFLLSIALLVGCNQNSKEDQHDHYLDIPEIILTPLQQQVHNQINDDWQTGLQVVKIDSILKTYVDSAFIATADSLEWKGQSNTHERIRKEFRYETFKIGTAYDFLINMNDCTMGLMIAKDYNILSHMQSIDKYYQRLLGVLEGNQKENLIKNQALWSESLKSDIEFSREMMGEHGTETLYLDYTDRRHRLRFLYRCYEDAYINYLLSQDISL
ncbi:MAG: hypothetical protein RR212_00685 [Bacteroidales bacterium]